MPEITYLEGIRLGLQRLMRERPEVVLYGEDVGAFGGAFKVTLGLQEEFGKMGLTIELQDDLMLVKGGNGLRGASVHSHHDHRIAMACAVAALKAEGNTTIAKADAINKSYPDFYEHIRSLGAKLKQEA